MSFGALFAKQSKEYALHRPTYPPALFDAIDQFASSVAAAATTAGKASSSSGAARHERALDVACGSGQATLALAERYNEVIGIDSAPEQLDEAPQHPKVSYLVGSANDIPRSLVADHSCDLVTVAQGFHWFDFPRAFTEISRVLTKPLAAAAAAGAAGGATYGAGATTATAAGVCAVWGYGNPVLENLEANRHVNVDFYSGAMGRYWNDRRRHVDNSYSEIEAEMRKHFERVEVNRDSLVILKEASIADFVRYVSSWSAYQTWKKQHPGEVDVLKALERDICTDYGVESSEAFISFRYPIFLLLGAVPKAK